MAALFPLFVLMVRAPTPVITCSIPGRGQGVSQEWRCLRSPCGRRGGWQALGLQGGANAVWRAYRCHVVHASRCLLSCGRGINSQWLSVVQAALHVYVNNEGAKKLYAANGWVERKTDSTIKSMLMARLLSRKL